MSKILDETLYGLLGDLDKYFALRIRLNDIFSLGHFNILKTRMSLGFDSISSAQYNLSPRVSEFTICQQNPGIAEGLTENFNSEKLDRTRYRGNKAQKQCLLDEKETKRSKPAFEKNSSITWFAPLPPAELVLAKEYFTEGIKCCVDICNIRFRIQVLIELVKSELNKLSTSERANLVTALERHPFLKLTSRSDISLDTHTVVSK